MHFNLDENTHKIEALKKEYQIAVQRHEFLAQQELIQDLQQLQRFRCKMRK